MNIQSAQACVAISIIIYTICQLIASIGAINGSRFNVTFHNFFVIPSWIIISMEEVLNVVLIFFGIDIFCPHYRQKKGDKYLKSFALTFCIGMIFISVGVLTAPFELLIASSAFYGLAVVIFFFIVFDRFSGRISNKMNIRQKYLWQQAISGFHIFQMIIFVLTISCAVEKDFPMTATSKYWFFAWTILIAFCVLFFYSMMSIKFLPPLINGLYFAAVAATYFDVNGSVGIVAVIAATVPIAFWLLFAGCREFKL